MDKGSEVIKIVEWNLKGQGVCFIFRTAECMFPIAECTFRSGEYTFRSGERTYRSAEYKTEACPNIIMMAIVITL